MEMVVDRGGGGEEWSGVGVAGVGERGGAAGT